MIVDVTGNYAQRQDTQESEVNVGGLLVHEWIAKRGGSERVLEAAAEVFESADIQCLWNDDPAAYGSRTVKESWLARSPLRNHKALALPAMPFVWRMTPNDGYDWMFISTHLFAHHARLRGAEHVPKFVYAHTPARYIWTPELDARGDSLSARLASVPLKSLDRRRAREATSIAANSAFVSERIARTWGLESRVIYPPVDTSELQAVADWSARLGASDAAQMESLPDAYVLGASRFIPYKRLDLVIRAGEAAGIPVVLAGSGPLLAELRNQASTASVPVTIIEDPSDSLIRCLFQKALVYVFPAVEDFGIMPVESMALGTPVVANAVGGASESVISGLTGSLLEGESSTQLAVAVEAAARLDELDCKERAKVFSKERFQTEIYDWVDPEKFN
ncbi:glycosyltransferase [Arthrobacter sp. 3Tela_A]|uniref:glycosyltransferase n=1 Tax=Arthrobacter sp. 3Tela_A TaxID=3093743 RepID=UPI003BB69149